MILRPLGLAAALLYAASAAAQTVPVPAAITVEGVPPIPAELARSVQPYLDFRTAAFLDWDPATRGALIATRFGNTPQLHLVRAPGAARTQLSFEPEPVVQAQIARKGDVTLVTKDVGGGEFFQLYRLENGRLTLLTDGKSRNDGVVWNREGMQIGYSSTRRNGTTTDLYVMDPRNPASDRMVLAVNEPGWSFADFAPGGAKALVVHRISIEHADVFEMDVASAKLTAIPLPGGATAGFDKLRYGPDGTIYAATDAGSDLVRFGVLDRTKGFRPLGPATRWEVEDFDIADDGSVLAVVTNEAGVSRLRLLDPKTGAVLSEPKLPAGVIGGLRIAPWGAVGFSLASATSPADMWSVDPATGAATRWTMSETGGLDPKRNREPELVTVKSFDGTPVSGFLYMPDPARFPGKRPLLLDIHGGPEGQSRPGFQGRNNYLVNELGIALFFPNVRGSTGYGKAFLAADNGPWKREDTVKDIGAFLDALTARPDIDTARVAETGGSYGGYMCYASAIRYGARLKAAQCTVAISNFVSLLENTQSYRRDLRRVEYGDERDPKQRAKLMEISPLTRAAELKIPLLVITGGNDPRVPPSEAAQMLKAVRANGVPAWHILAANEGHGYRKKDNVDYSTLAVIRFWQETLLK